jgi:hypothetical protein
MNSIYHLVLGSMEWCLKSSTSPSLIVYFMCNLTGLWVAQMVKNYFWCICENSIRTNELRKEELPVGAGVIQFTEDPNKIIF